MVNLYHIDCMEFMADKPDKYYDLAIVDPPYGLDMDDHAYQNGVNCKANGFKDHRKGRWDDAIPDSLYFNELFRVSKNQIIWGGNYMTKFLKPTMCWIIWNKVQRNFSFSDGEMAWSSFDLKLKIFDYARGNESGFAPKIKAGMKNGCNIHPTQKPIALYEWLLMNYAKPGDKILDTHGGSGSICIACHNLGFDLDWCELDAEYFEEAKKRFDIHKAQLRIFQ